MGLGTPGSLGWAIQGVSGISESLWRCALQGWETWTPKRTLQGRNLEHLTTGLVDRNPERKRRTAMSGNTDVRAWILVGVFVNRTETHSNVLKGRQPRGGHAKWRKSGTEAQASKGGVGSPPSGLSQNSLSSLLLSSPLRSSPFLSSLSLSPLSLSVSLPLSLSPLSRFSLSHSLSSLFFFYPAKRPPRSGTRAGPSLSLSLSLFSRLFFLFFFSPSLSRSSLPLSLSFCLSLSLSLLSFSSLKPILLYATNPFLCDLSIASNRYVWELQSDNRFEDGATHVPHPRNCQHVGDATSQTPKHDASLRMAQVWAVNNQGLDCS